ncbi:MAG TPA: hypothetical protein DCY74_10390 [Clostridiales bacterium]|jgi:hypothetical protein|nr:hypothetical protein [Clostridiales bacterium]HBE14566.1 hypothetical protein [Clostridiales bacterium]
MKKGDYIVMAFSILLVGVLCFFLYGQKKNEALYVEIIVGNEVVDSLPLNQDTVYSVNGVDLTVKIEDKQVCVMDTGCPDRLCKAAGRISQAGRSIICLPQKVIVRINGTFPVDAVAGGMCP